MERKEKQKMSERQNFKIEEKENREHRTEQKTTDQHQNLTIRSGTTYNNK